MSQREEAPASWTGASHSGSPARSLAASGRPANSYNYTGSSFAFLLHFLRALADLFFLHFLSAAARWPVALAAGGGAGAT